MNTQVAFVIGLVIALAAIPMPSMAQQDALRGLGLAEPEEEAPARSIAQTSSLSEDRTLKKRLTEIYAQVEGLEGITLEVHAGVVQLSGEVFSDAARDRAIRIANQLQGVAEVQDEIVESRDLERRLRPVLSDLRDRLLDFLAGAPLFGVSVMIFAFFVLAGRLASHWDAPYRRITRNPFARNVARQAVNALFFLVGMVVALDILDATAVVAAIAGIAGLAGLAISFAFHDLVENYIASVLLSLRQPFQADDHIIIGEHEGRVVRLTSRATILMTLDGNHLRIPNANVYKGTILNYSTNPERRFGFEAVVAENENIASVMSLGIATLEAMPGILAEPSPGAWVQHFAETGVALYFSAWIDQRETDWFKARGEAIRVVKDAFDEAGILKPEPTVGVRSLPAIEVTHPETRPATETQPATGTRPQAPPSEAPEIDISRDTQIEDVLAEDRASGGLDLLDPTHPQE